MARSVSTGAARRVTARAWFSGAAAVLALSACGPDGQATNLVPEREPAGTSPQVDGTPDRARFPSAANTGVPPGTDLREYDGPMTITTPGTVVEGREIRGNLVIEARDVTVVDSRLHGVLRSVGDSSVTVRDSDIDGGPQQQFAAVGLRNITLRGVEVVGGLHSVQCEQDCIIEDSFLHSQHLPSPPSPAHVDGFISNGGSRMLLRRNTVLCSVPHNGLGGGCTSDIALFGDFAPLRDIVIEDNLLLADNDSLSYCLSAGLNPDKPFGANPRGVRIRNNVFAPGKSGRCGLYGPIAFFSTDASNEWSSNRWLDDGGLVQLP